MKRAHEYTDATPGRTQTVPDMTRPQRENPSSATAAQVAEQATQAALVRARREANCRPQPTKTH